MTENEAPVILIAEDEQTVAEGYELWLTGQYQTRLATDGAEAVEMIDDTVDIVLLDRMMPKISGKQVLEEIRERGIDCRVAMVTAVQPDFDIIEMGFDAYITKPPDREEFIDTIEELLERSRLQSEFQEYYSLMARKGALQSQKSEEELENNDEYLDLLDRIESKRAAVDDGIGDMGSEIDFVSAIREIDDGARFEESDRGDSGEETR